MDASISDFYESEAGKEYVADLIKQAEMGDALSQYQLADQYWLGWGMQQDRTKAVKWYTQAAEQGLAEAQNSLGGIYLNGEGVAQDYPAAVKWYTLAANQGNADSQNVVGFLYASGKGVGQNYTEAARWYTLAAEQGKADAQLMLGTMHVKGWGVPKNYEQAVKWYTLAAEQGLAEAQKNLGVMYANGDGVSQDAEKAVYWYTLAAEQGDADAQFNLSVRYGKGQGVVEDFVEAYKWALLAGMNGYDVAESKVWLRSHMTPEQVANAQELARAVAPQMPRTDPETLQEAIISKTQPHSPAENAAETETSEAKPSDLDAVSRKTQNGPDMYVSQSEGFAVYFPTAPQRTVVKDNADSQVIHYQAVSDDGFVQYNLFFYNFRSKKILGDKFQKAYLQSYLAGRQTLGGKDKFIKRELEFQRGNAVVFKQMISQDNTKMTHEGMNFFVDGNSIVLTCIYPSSHAPSPTFNEFVKSFELVVEDAPTQ